MARRQMDLNLILSLLVLVIVFLRRVCRLCLL
nr:MAG TPA: hypothetical protein [Caudoviricetes sp.]